MRSTGIDHDHGGIGCHCPANKGFTLRGLVGSHTFVKIPPNHIPLIFPPSLLHTCDLFVDLRERRHCHEHDSWLELQILQPPQWGVCAVLFSSVEPIKATRKVQSSFAVHCCNWTNLDKEQSFLQTVRPRGSWTWEFRRNGNDPASPCKKSWIFCSALIVDMATGRKESLPVEDHWRLAFRGSLVVCSTDVKRETLTRQDLQHYTCSRIMCTIPQLRLPWGSFPIDDESKEAWRFSSGPFLGLGRKMHPLACDGPGSLFTFSG